MSQRRVGGFGVSPDEFAAGPRQSLGHLLGERGPELFQWIFPTRAFRAMQGKTFGSTGPDDEFGRRAMASFGAFFLGRKIVLARSRRVVNRPAARWPCGTRPRRAHALLVTD